MKVNDLYFKRMNFKTKNEILTGIISGFRPGKIFIKNIVNINNPSYVQNEQWFDVKQISEYEILN